jgi:hypothetical protein
MVYECEGDIWPNLMAEIPEHGTVKILGVVDHDLLWDSIVTNDVLPEEFFDGSRDYVGNGLRFNPFGEVLHCDYGKIVVSLYWCKFTHDVDAPSLQGSRWGDQLRGLCGSLGVMREFLTGFAG